MLLKGTVIFKENSWLCPFFFLDFNSSSCDLLVLHSDKLLKYTSVLGGTIFKSLKVIVRMYLTSKLEFNTRKQVKLWKAVENLIWSYDRA